MTRPQAHCRAYRSPPKSAIQSGAGRWRVCSTNSVKRISLSQLEKVDKTAKKKGAKGSEKLARVPGFICPSDSTAFEASFTRPVSYRAATGDSPTGSNGAFALGRKIDLAKLDGQDGLSYTAAFSERLVGNGRERSESTRNYALLAGPVSAEVGTSPVMDLWRGDAGSDWSEATWRSTLYNHSIVPGASPSSIAGDGRSARMGASSGHGNHVFVLMLDGRVQRVSYDVDPVIWARPWRIPTTSPQSNGRRSRRRNGLNASVWA